LAGSAAALAKNFESFDFKLHQGAAPELATVIPKVRTELRLNEAAWQALSSATPLIVYRTQDDKILMQAGLPPEERFIEMMKSMRAPQLPVFK